MNKPNITEDEIISLKDLRLNTQHYIDQVSHGGKSYIVVKRSRPAFRIDPIEEQWETIIDFTEINKDGVSAEDVIKAIDELTT